MFVTSNDYIFKRTIWNGISVIQEVYSGYYLISKACTEYGKLLSDWMRNNKTISLLNIASKTLSLTSTAIEIHNTNELMGNHIGSLFLKINNLHNDYKGYVHTKQML